MYKNSYSFFLTAFFIPTIIVGMGTPPSTPTPTNTPSMGMTMPTSVPAADNAQPATINATNMTTKSPTTSTTPLLTEKDKVAQELKKNKAKLTKIKEKDKLAPVLAIIEGRLGKIIASSEFKSVIEKLASKEAQEINEGKSFNDVKYNHSLSTDFPKMTNPNKFLAWVYSIMANIEHYQLLLEKLGNAKEAQPATTPTTPSDTTTPATAPTPTAGTTPEATPPATPPSSTTNETPKSPA